MVQKSDFCFWFMGTIGNAERSKHAALIRVNGNRKGFFL